MSQDNCHGMEDADKPLIDSRLFWLMMGFIIAVVLLFAIMMFCFNAPL